MNSTIDGIFAGILQTLENRLHGGDESRSAEQAGHDTNHAICRIHVPVPDIGTIGKADPGGQREVSGFTTQEGYILKSRSM